MIQIPKVNDLSPIIANDVQIMKIARHKTKIIFLVIIIALSKWMVLKLFCLSSFDFKN